MDVVWPTPGHPTGQPDGPGVSPPAGARQDADVTTNDAAATGLPEGFTRLLVAASICALVPAVIAAVLAERRFGTFFGRLRPEEHELASSS